MAFQLILFHQKIFTQDRTDSENGKLHQAAKFLRHTDEKTDGPDRHQLLTGLLDGQANRFFIP
jgi:hypothetical protein